MSIDIFIADGQVGFVLRGPLTVDGLVAVGLTYNSVCVVHWLRLTLNVFVGLNRIIVLGASIVLIKASVASGTRVQQL